MRDEKKTAEPISIHRRASLDFIKNSGGFAVKAIRGQKEPARGWNPRANSRGLSEQLLVELYSSDDNVGVHLHGSLVDVDVDSDSPFLIPAIDRFLPSCGHVWGRRSRPRTHRVYSLRGDPSFDPASYPLLKRLGRIQEAKVELRGGPQSRGEYSLLPGSIHPSGETYEWADLHRAQSSPSVVDLEDLLRGIRLASAVAVIAPFWQEGLRNDLVLGLSGFLHRAFTISDGMGEDAFRLDIDAARQFVEALLDITEDDTKDRVSRLKTFDRTWAKAESGSPVTGASTIAEVTGDSRIVSKLYSLLAESPELGAIEAFVSRFAIWQGPGVVVDMDLIEAGDKTLMSRQAFVNSYGHQYIHNGEGKPKLLADMLFHMKATTRVAGVTFEPGQPRFVETRSGRKINQWAGFEIKPWPEPVDRTQITPFLNYLFDVVCTRDPEAYSWVISWLANLFQHPANKPKTALVLVGKQGAGKSVLGHLIVIPIIGKQHAASTDSVEALTKDFNVAFDNKLFIQCDEATNNKQKRMAARLKALISDPEKLVEPKGVDAFHKPNHSRFFFTSNDVEDALYMGDGLDDRRYTVLEVSSAYKDMVVDYWDPFYRWHSDVDNLAKIHRYLLDFEYDRFRIMRPYVTEAKKSMQQHSWEPFDQWLCRWVAREHPLAEANHLDWHDAPIDPQKIVDRSEWPVRVSRVALVRDFELYCRHHARNTPALNEIQMGIAFHRRNIPFGDERKLRVKDWDDRKQCNVEKRVRIVEVPGRDTLVKYLEERYGFAFMVEVNRAATEETDARPDDSDSEY